MAPVVTLTAIKQAATLLCTTSFAKAMIADENNSARESTRNSRMRPGFPSSLALFDSSLLERAGITVIDTTSESTTATEMATAISRNSWPASSSMTRIGMKTITVVRAETSTAPQT